MSQVIYRHQVITKIRNFERWWWSTNKVGGCNKFPTRMHLFERNYQHCDVVLWSDLCVMCHHIISFKLVTCICHCICHCIWKRRENRYGKISFQWKYHVNKFVFFFFLNNISKGIIQTYSSAPTIDLEWWSGCNLIRKQSHWLYGPQLLLSWATKWWPNDVLRHDSVDSIYAVVCDWWPVRKKLLFIYLLFIFENNR